MIFVQDNVLPEPMFRELQNFCKSGFKITPTLHKSFDCKRVPDEIVEQLQIEGYEMIFSFIRRAYKGFDNDWRIHADNVINLQQSALATVLYINEPEGVTKNGTAFWSHNKYGHELPKDVSNEEFNRLLSEDSNNIELWEQTGFIAAVPNRLVTYNSNYFHSKYPAEITEGTRIVLAAFYKQNL
jgi:hypothetical protein